MGDAVRTVGQLKGELTLNKGHYSPFIPACKECYGWASYGSFAVWMRHVHRVGGRIRHIHSPYGVGGETGYTAQEDLKSINSDNMGEGRRIRFFHSCVPRSSLIFSALLSWGHCMS